MSANPSPAEETNVTPFPYGRVARLRRLANACLSNLDFEKKGAVSDSALFSFSLEQGGCVLRVDEYASIDLFPDSPDYRFLLVLNDGCHVLWVTDDLIAMAEFLQQYILARLEFQSGRKEGFPC